jgi:hypothetical protein
MQQLLIGADPELFVQDTTGAFISAHTLIPGTKQHPYTVPNGAIQVDGTALEFNINPASSADEFIFNINSLLLQLKQEVEKNETLTLSISPIASFSVDYLDSLPPSTTELGCTPDFNAYTGTENMPPASNVTYRTASGHVHIGWTKDADPYDPEHFTFCQALSKQLDIALFIPSLLFDPDNTRRTLYGRPGAFRPKPYGLEYRVLSNVWITSEALIQWVYDTTIKATQDLADGFSYTVFIKPKQIHTLTSMTRQKAREKAIRKLAETFSFIQLPSM